MGGKVHFSSAMSRFFSPFGTFSTYFSTLGPKNMSKMSTSAQPALATCDRKTRTDLTRRMPPRRGSFSRSRSSTARRRGSETAAPTRRPGRAAGTGWATPPPPPAAGPWVTRGRGAAADGRPGCSGTRPAAPRAGPRGRRDLTWSLLHTAVLTFDGFGFLKKMKWGLRSFLLFRKFTLQWLRLLKKWNEQ